MPNRKLLDSWIDQERLSELFAGLRSAALEKEAPDSGSGNADPVAPAQQTLFAGGLAEAEVEEPKSDVAVAARPSPPKRINPLTLYFPPPSGSLESRARAFIEWAKEVGESSEGFIVDGYGAAIAKDTGLDDVLLASVSNLADGLGRGMAHFSQSGQGALHLELSEGRILCLIQSKWDASTVALGLIGANGLDREVADRLRVELGRLDRKRRRDRD